MRGSAISRVRHLRSYSRRCEGAVVFVVLGFVPMRGAVGARVPPSDGSCFEIQGFGGFAIRPLVSHRAQLIIRYVSEGSYALLRRTPESMIGTLSEDLVHGGDQVSAAGWGHVVECHCGVTGRFVGGVG